MNNTLLKCAIIFFIATIFNFSSLFAQRPDPIGVARTYLSMGKTDSALIVYKYAYEEEPFNQKIYDEYLALLIKEKKYEDALKLAEFMSDIKRDDVGILMDKVGIFESMGAKKDARKLKEQIIANTAKKGDYDLKKAIGILESNKQYDVAIAILEKKNGLQDNIFQMLPNSDNQLSKLYLISGNFEKAFPIYLQNIPYNQDLEADFKSRLLSLFDADSKNKERAKSLLKKLMNDKSLPTATIAQILTWIGDTHNSNKTAIETLITKDNKTGEQWQAIFQLAIMASYENNYKDAMTAYKYLSEVKLDDEQLKEKAKSEWFKNSIYRIYQKRPVDMDLVNVTVHAMRTYYELNPNRRTDALFLSYTDLIAKYLRNPSLAGKLVTEVVDSLRPNRQYLGYAKMALGDYALFQGDVWDANLYYAQVDKMFKQDQTGEEARFKQAKVAFYRGDFKWAQQSLNILKTSTTEMLSNDAMQLSIVITENTAEDTASLPLQMYAKADLLIYQQQYDSAKNLLKELMDTYPEHGLMDDVLLLSGKIEEDEGAYVQAVNYYQKLLEKYKDDVLADDANFRIGNIYADNLKDKEKAKVYYENLIIDYPLSTLVAPARAKLQSLQSNNQ